MIRAAEKLILIIPDSNNQIKLLLKIKWIPEIFDSPSFIAARLIDGLFFCDKLTYPL